MLKTQASLRTLAGWISTACVGLVLVLPSHAAAQPYEIVQSFVNSAGAPRGALVRMGDSFVGTTFDGGRFGRGAIFALHPLPGGGWTHEDLHSFSGPDGAAPSGGVTLAPDGSFYGTTDGGGEFDRGTVFRFDTCGALTTLHSFPSNVLGEPAGPLVVSGGSVYGAWPGLTIFRIDAQGAYSILHSLAPGEGDIRRGGLVQGPDGVLYGVTYFGGAYVQGSVFRIDAAGTFTTLHSFQVSEGRWPMAPLTAGPGGFLWGTTSAGGFHGAGTIFRIDPVGQFEVMHELDFPEGGQSTTALTLASDGAFYGSTEHGGAYGHGTLFRIDTSGAFEVHDDFLEWPPSSSLTEGSDGALYGCKYVWEIFRAEKTGPASPIYTFVAEGPSNSYTPLIEAADGSFWGTSDGGGVFGLGTVFRIDTSGDLTVVHAFQGSDGSAPQGPLVEGDDGIYGTTREGGSNWGTVFRIVPDGTLTTLHSFGVVDGAFPQAGLMRADDGHFYGTTSGGAFAGGTVFRITAGGIFTSLHSFSGPDGWAPKSALFQGSDGALYGTTEQGDTSFGTVFRMALNGDTTTLHAFPITNEEGALPYSTLIEDGSGNLLGTTSGGGLHVGGTIFRVALDGAFATLHDFDYGVEGSQPHAGLIQAPDGYFYGTTTWGPDRFGSVYRMDAAGDVTLVHAFQGPEGEEPYAGLLAASGGALYGTAFSAGPGGGGVVFRLPATLQPPVLSGISPSSGAADGALLTATGNRFDIASQLLLGATPARTAVNDARLLHASTVGLSPGEAYDVTVSTPGGVSTLPQAFFADFTDVVCPHPFRDFVEIVARAGISAGCGAGNFCPGNPVTRAQMAVFLLKAEHGAAYTPPPCTDLFQDVACPGPFTDWIEQLAAEGITTGCGGGNYCPGDPVTRAQMAVLLLKTLLGSAYAPPVVAQIFDDVPPGAFAYDFINDLSTRGITSGCSASPLLYCPANSNTRGQMAVFLVRTFGL